MSFMCARHKEIKRHMQTYIYKYMHTFTHIHTYIYTQAAALGIKCLLITNEEIKRQTKPSDA